MKITLRSLSFALLCILTSCGGTGTGNPGPSDPGTAGSLPANGSIVLSGICNLLTTCNPSLSLATCSTGVLAVTGLDVHLGLPSGQYTSLSSIITAENNGLITGNATAASQCVSDLSQLSCGNQAVIDAYQSGNANPFAQVPAMMPSGSGSCPAVY